MPSTPPINIPITAQDKTRAAFRGVDDRMTKLTRTASGLFTQLAAVAGVGGMGALIKSGLDAAENLGNLSKRLGASTEALSQYQHVAKMTGVSFDTLTNSWRQMTRGIAEAAKGTGAAKNAMHELGLSTYALRELRPEQQFELIADAMQGVGRQGDKVRLAMQIFGEEGISLLQMMDGGSKGMRAYRAEADRFGLTLNNLATQKARDANQALRRVQAAINGTANEIAINAGPAMEELAGYMSETVPSAAKVAIGALNAVIEDTRATAEWAAAWQSGHISFWEWFTTGNEGAKQRLAEIKGAMGFLDIKPQRIKPFEIQQGSGMDMLNPEETTKKLFNVQKSRQEALGAYELEFAQTHHQKVLDMEANNLGQRNSQYRTAAEERAEIEALWGDRVRSIQDSVYGNLSGLLQTAAGRSRAAALLVLGIEKARGISEVLINTKVAAMRALAELGPIAGPPVAAKITALGKVSAALIGATGLAQAASVGSEGAALGTAANPVSVAGAAPAALPAPSPTRHVTVNVSSDASMVSMNWIRDQLMPALNEALGDGVKIDLSGQRMPA